MEQDTDNKKDNKRNAGSAVRSLRRLILRSSEPVLIMTHVKPDLDAIGSALGIYRIAAAAGKKANIVLDRPNPMIGRLMQKICEDVRYKDVFINCGAALSAASGGKSAVIVVDTYRPGFTECPGLLERSEMIAVIDHHRKGLSRISDAVLVYHNDSASSASEIVLDMIRHMPGRGSGRGLCLRACRREAMLSPIEAEALYSGIVLDTKNFTFKTGVRTFEAASFLKKQGVDTVAVRQLFQNDLDTFISKADTIKSAIIINSCIAVSVCPGDALNPQLVAAQAADELLALSGVKAAFVLGFEDDEVFISGRSFGDINVHAILEKLGGGGHFSVAGAQMQGITVDAAKEMLIEAVRGYIKLNCKENAGGIRNGGTVL